MIISKTFLQDLLDIYGPAFMASRRNGRFVSVHLMQGTMPTQAELTAMYVANKKQAANTSIDITSKEVITQLVASGAVSLGYVAYAMDATTKKLYGPEHFKRIFALSRDVVPITSTGTMNYLVIQRGSTSAVNVANSRIDHVLIYSIGLAGSGADIIVSDVDVSSGTKVVLNDITLDFTQLLSIAG